MRRYVRKAAKVARRKWKSKMKRKAAKRINNIYRFKRLTNTVRIQHLSGDAAAIFRIEDFSGILRPTTSSGVSWTPESLPNTYTNTFGCVHNLSDVAIPGDFTNLFDRYKITGIKATFLYQITDAAAGGAPVMPTILYATDYTDSDPPSYSLMRTKQNTKQRILTANRPFSIFYRPKKTVLTTSNFLSIPGTYTNAGWCASSAPDIDHYGLKFSLNNLYGTASTNSQLEIKFVYYLAMKDPQ